ncbi:MAG: sialate O-acetylesterase [Planctomycetota bacterium]
MRLPCLLTRLAVLTLLLAALPTQAADTVRVFILAGQSNMEGKADLNLLRHQMTDAKTADFFKHLHKDGEFIVRDDVFIDYNNNAKMPRGGLQPGYGSPNKFGVELEFGNTVGDHFDEPVLLIKAAWGGKSIGRDFLPPSKMPDDAGFAQMAAEAKAKYEQQLAEHQKKAAEGKNSREPKPAPTIEQLKQQYGHFYREMMKHVQDVLKNKDTYFPALKGKEPVLSGFVWFQGFNDKFGGLDLQYETNMEAFIKDVREELGKPKLPFVIGVMGQNGSKPASGTSLTIQEAQLAQPNKPAFKGNVAAVRTDVLADQAAEAAFPTWRENFEEWKKIGSDRPYHYLGSAIWFSRMGDAFGEAMLELMGEK